MDGISVSPQNFPENISVISIMRNSLSYIDRYIAQFQALRDVIPLRVVVAEGDSDDGTYAQLGALAGFEDFELHKIEHGGPVFNSTDNPQRWSQIAYVYNTLLDLLEPEGPVILVESDLIWQPETMLGLLKQLGVGIDAIAPLSVKGYYDLDGHRLPGERFYDTWGHRWPDGTRFSGELSEVVSDGKMLRPISSAGSCIVMKEEVARKARFGAEDGIVGFCADLHRLGFHLYLDDQLRVEHP